MSKDTNHLINFDIDTFNDAFDAYVDDMHGIIRKAIYSTMGRLRRHVKTLLSERIRQKWNIKKKDLDMYIRVNIGARGDDYESFEMTIKGSTISLSKFGAKQTLGNRVQTRRKGYTKKNKSKFQGVEVEVIKGRKIKLKRSWLHVKGSHIMVLRRQGRARTPIALRVVVSPASIYQNERYHQWFDEQVVNYIEKEFNHQLSYRLQQANYS